MRICHVPRSASGSPVTEQILFSYPSSGLERDHSRNKRFYQRDFLGGTCPISIIMTYCQAPGDRAPWIWDSHISGPRCGVYSLLLETGHSLISVSEPPRVMPSLVCHVAWSCAWQEGSTGVGCLVEWELRVEINNVCATVSPELTLCCHLGVSLPSQTSSQCLGPARMFCD